MIYISLALLIITVVFLGTLGVLIKQLRDQRVATESFISNNRVRTRLYQDADEATTLILSRTLQNVSVGTHDPNLAGDSFAMRVVRELVKRKIPKNRWLEIQTNERLIHELFILLQKVDMKYKDQG